MLAKLHFDEVTKGSGDNNENIDENKKQFIQQLNERGTRNEDAYLDELLKLCKCTSLPKKKLLKIKKIVLFMNASESERPYILKTLKDNRQLTFL